MRTDVYSLHRRKTAQSDDRAIIPNGSREDVLAHFVKVPLRLRSEYFALLAGMKFNHLELEKMARQQHLLDGDK